MGIRWASWALECDIYKLAQRKRGVSHSTQHFRWPWHETQACLPFLESWNLAADSDSLLTGKLRLEATRHSLFLTSPLWQISRWPQRQTPVLPIVQWSHCCVI